MTPDFRVVIDGSQDITNRIRERLLLLSVTDGAGERSDAAEIRLDDRDRVLEPPPRGREMEISLGYAGGEEVVTGRYTVDEVELAGPPSTLVVRGRGVDMRASLKAQKTRSWDDVTLAALVSEIAAEHGLEPSVGRSLRGLSIPHLDQSDESDMHLLTRLARGYDAVAKPAGGKLLFLGFAEAESATGRPMPLIRVRPDDASRWRVTLADREAYRSVHAHWRARGTAVRKTEAVGGGEPAYTLRRLYPSAAEAREAARAKHASLQRGTARLAVTLSPGDPVAAAETELLLTGFGAGIDGRWSCQSVRHDLGRGGYRTSIEGTLKMA